MVSILFKKEKRILSQTHFKADRDRYHSLVLMLQLSDEEFIQLDDILTEIIKNKLELLNL